MTITYKHGMSELPRELPNDLRLRTYHTNDLRPTILGNRRKVSKLIE